MVVQAESYIVVRFIGTSGIRKVGLVGFTIFFVEIFTPVSFVLTKIRAKGLNLGITHQTMFFPEVEQLIGAHHVVPHLGAGQVRNAIRSIYRQVTLFTATSFFGGVNHHTIGSTRTIDRGSRCIFKHRNTGNIIRTDGKNGGGIDGYTIQDVERLRTSGKCPDTTHRDAGSRRRFTRRSVDLYTRHLTLQGIVDVSNRAVFDFIGGDSGYRARHRTEFLPRTVAHHHSFTQCRVTVGQHNVHCAGHAHRLRFHTDVGNRHRLCTGRQFCDTEITLVIGDCDHLITHFDSCTNNRFAIFVGNVALHRRLGGGSSGHQKRCTKDC